MNNNLDILKAESIALLKELIAIPSFSKQEDQTAGAITRFIGAKNIEHTRVGNNVFALNKFFDKNKPSLLLNSHHDTVKPNAGYTKDPFSPVEENDRLYGLGSNDAGGCLVSLLATFLYYYDRSDLKYNIIFAATAEEEISGTGGIEYTLPYLPAINCAIVGEPTLMEMAIAEKGLMVLDCISRGKPGHAAREEGDNAVVKAAIDVQWFHDFKFPLVSELLGPNKMSVTVIETENKAHNVVPASCSFVVDSRINELYTFEAVLEIIRAAVSCEVIPRSTRLRSSLIPLDHPLVKAGSALGKKYYGSPTTSDKALMPFPALKLGPGDSARSHSADEYIYIKEIEKGIEDYVRLLNELV